MVFSCQKKKERKKEMKTHYKEAKQGFRVYLGFTYFVETENLLLKVL